MPVSTKLFKKLFTLLSDFLLPIHFTIHDSHSQAYSTRYWGKYGCQGRLCLNLTITPHLTPPPDPELQVSTGWRPPSCLADKAACHTCTAPADQDIRSLFSMNIVCI